jgi:hypothetical protein
MENNKYYNVKIDRLDIIKDIIKSLSNIQEVCWKWDYMTKEYNYYLYKNLISEPAITVGTFYLQQESEIIALVNIMQTELIRYLCNTYIRKSLFVRIYEKYYNFLEYRKAKKALFKAMSVPAIFEGINKNVITDVYGAKTV